MLSQNLYCVHSSSSIPSIRFVDGLFGPNNAKPFFFHDDILTDSTFSPLDANLPYADDFQPAPEVAEEPGIGGLKTETSGSSAEREYDRILSDISAKQRDDEEINAILQDWKLLAQKVDYILFWVFLALTTVSSCIFIFILPYYKRGKLL